MVGAPEAVTGAACVAGERREDRLVLVARRATNATTGHYLGWMVDEHAAFGGEQLSHLYRERFSEKGAALQGRDAGGPLPLLPAVHPA